jgi:hypothetical protein
MKTREPPTCGMPTSSPPGSPSCGSIYSIGTVVSDTFQTIPATSDDAYPPTSALASPETKNYKNPALDHPIDIFGTSPGHSANTNGSQVTLKPLPKKPARMPIRCRKLRQAVAEIETLNEKMDYSHTISPRSRRVASRTDHPLECDSPRRIPDAEDLDLENKIRSALRRRRPIPHSNASINKTVRFDPAIISLGSEKPIVNADGKSLAYSELAIQKHRSEPDEHGGSGLKESLQAILLLKKHERAKLRELLDSISKIEESPPNVQSVTTGKRLNPRAPEFYGTVKPLNCPEDPDDFGNSWSMIPTYPLYRPTLPPIWMLSSKPIDSLPRPVFPIPPAIQTFQPYLGRFPIVSPLPTTQDGHGREATLVGSDWNKSILEKFEAKYPLTGKVKAVMPGESKGRLAAAIQQRLEYLLMEERDKKGMKKADQKENATLVK